MTSHNQYDMTPANGSDKQLFDRIVAILEQARGNVVRAVNSSMVLAYWQIGQEIVNEIQGGDERAEYGKGVVQELSRRLSAKYGRGFSTTNLWYFRQFYLTFSDRKPKIRHKVCGEFAPAGKLHKACGESPSATEGDRQSSSVLDDLSLAIERPEQIEGFSPRLSWSHYRTLAKLENRCERLFYEIETERENWSVPHLERQIHSFLFGRLMKSRNKFGVMELARRGQSLETPIDAIKDPYILDFLGLPDSPPLHECDLEQAIITNLQAFLLELGKGFAFVARQKRMRFDDQDFYIDLVFYHCILKCYVLIDLKIGPLTHQDIGQMDGYVRMFDAQGTSDGDHSTIGLILCSEKNEAIVKYSVLNESHQLFAAKYLPFLPSEQELRRELMRERQLIEARLAESNEAAE